VPTTYTDSFNRSGTIAPGSTETGGGTWAYSGNGAASANGASAVVNLAGGFLYLDVGFGDVDVETVLQSYGTLVIRAGANDGRCFRIRKTSRNESSGGYVTAPQYVAMYTHQACENYTSYSSQCNNNSFPQTVAINCYNGSTFVNTYKYLQSVSQSGTCQVYQSSSYTVYTVTFEAVAADGTVTNLGSRSVNYSSTARLVANSTSVQAYVDGSLIASTTDDDAVRRAQGRHGIAGQAVADAFSLTVLNTAPNAPLLVAPVAGAVVDRGVATVLSWQFSDADATDVQSKADVEVTVGGTSTLYTVTNSTQWVSVAPGTWSAGSVVSWRVRTYDAQGVQGPWSNSSTFTAATPPPAPTFSAPLDGSTIPTSNYTVAWVASAQDAYELRRGDVGSAATYQTVTGSAAARSATLTFDVNGRAERVGLRVRSGGLWSAWTFSAVTVSYTPPPQPGVVASPDPDLGAIEVDVTCPVPVGTQPRTVRFDLFRTAVRGNSGRGTEERVAAGIVPVEGSPSRWIDYTPASGVTYSYRAQAFGANGTSSTS
jgi:hypothetical protein